jgi:hypothetical protein
MASLPLLRRLSLLKSQRLRTANLHMRRGQSGKPPGVNLLVRFLRPHPSFSSFNPVASTALLRRLSPLKTQRPRTANLRTRCGQSGNPPGVNLLRFCRLRPSFSLTLDLCAAFICSSLFYLFACLHSLAATAIRRVWSRMYYVCNNH